MRNIHSIPTTWLLVAVVLFAAVLLAGYTFYPERDRVEGPLSETEPASEPLAHFTKQVEAQVIAERGQPIEGFTPHLFLSVYPGLVPADFDGVAAAQGRYEVVSGELTFVEDRGTEPSHSAAGMITREGMARLFAQVTARLDRPMDSTAEVDALLSELRRAVPDTTSDPHEDAGADASATGVVTSVDTTQAMIDGPFVITIETDTGTVLDITVPSMGLQLCVAREEIANVYDLEEGNMITVRGTFHEDGTITPCTSDEHYLRVIE